MSPNPEGGENQEHPENEQEKSAENSYRGDVIATLKAIAQEQKRANDEDASNRTLDRILEFGTVLGIWGAAFIAIWAICRSSTDAGNQRDVMQGQLNEMRAEQRPNLWFGTNLGAPQFILNTKTGKTGQIAWSVHLQNYGKSFITRGTYETFLRLGGEPFQKSFREPTPSIVSVVAPGQDIFVTAVSKPGYTVEDFTKFTTHDYGVVVMIKATYTDFTNTPYGASLCVENLQSGAIQFCRKSNSIK